MITTVKTTGQRVDVYRDVRIPAGDGKPERWRYREFSNGQTWDEYDLNVTAAGNSCIPFKDRIAPLVHKAEQATAAKQKKEPEQPKKKRGRKKKQPVPDELPQDPQITLKRKKGRDTSKIRLNELQMDILHRYYPTTDNEQLAALLGISQSTLHRMARKLNLKKTEIFMKACNENTTRCAHEKNKARGYAAQKAHAEKQWENYRKTGTKPSGCFKPGHHIKDTMTEEQYRDAMKRAGQTRKRTAERERTRLVFGLPQKTKMHVVFNRLDSHATSFRYNMRKRGYIVTRDDRTIYYNDETKRSQICERHAAEEGIKIEQWKP